MVRRSVQVVLLLLVGASPLVAASDAHANGYDVHACDSTWPSPGNGSFLPEVSNGMVAITDCPAGGGMTVRNVYDNGVTGAFGAASYVFDAPPGTSVESITFDAGVQRHNCAFGAAILASQLNDTGGRLAWGLPANGACDSFQTPGDTAFFPNRWGPIAINAPRVRLDVRCGAAACSRNGVTALRLRNAVVHVADDTRPSLAGARGPLGTSDGWLSGTQGVGFDAGDGSGIRETVIAVDGKEVAHRTNSCDYTLRAPCPPAKVDERFATQGFGGDGDHALSMRAVDAAGNVAETSRTVHVDNTAPSAPEALSVSGGDGWRKSNAFDVSWVNPRATGAPLAAARWSLCRDGSSADCVTGRQSGGDLTALSHVAVPGPGAWNLRVWLEDAAGNQDAQLAAAPVTLRWDETSPDVSLIAPGADDPTRLIAPVADQGSGIAGGEIAIRKTGSEAWRPLKTTLEGDHLVGVIDDEQLSDGSYELRARATDVAGNERLTTTFTSGEPAGIQLPLRLKTRLAAGVVRATRGRVKLVRAAYSSFGALVQVRGRLSTPEGNPMQGVAVRAFSQVRDGRSLPRLIATVTTSKTGRFSFLVRRGPSRTIQIRYDGAAQVRGASRRVVLYVRSTSTMRPNRLRLVNGETVRFTGRVATGRIPKKGKLVELEVLVRGRWRTFATTRASSRGSWAFGYRFDGTRGRQRYLFRAKIPRENGYPYAAGRSKIVHVTVQGV